MGWLGLCVMTMMNIGGGMTCRLLFDGLTTLICQIQDTFGIDLNHLYWTLFIVIRIEWYNFVSFRALYQCNWHEYGFYFQFFIIAWIIFANYYHYQLFRDGFMYNITVKRWFLDNYFVTICVVIIP